jgi:hypothetical protein
MFLHLFAVKIVSGGRELCPLFGRRWNFLVGLSS